MSAIERLLRGSVDMHCHHGPDTIYERSVDALDAARQAQQAGMRAVVIKSHVYPTAPLATIVSRVVPDITVVGAVCLDTEIGGLNIHALESSARLGAKIVWMPTFTSTYDMKKKGRPGSGLTLFDDNGKLLPVVDEILDIVKHNRMVLATGHVSPAESFALVERARTKGVEKIVVTHPLLEAAGATLSLEEQKRMADQGAFIEHTISLIMPSVRMDPMRIVEAVKAVGAERCIMSTDLGQAHNPTPADGMRVGIAVMLKSGLTEREVELMVKVNPCKLLDLA